MLCRLEDVSRIHVPIYPHLIGQGRRNCSILFDRKQMIEFFRKFENRGIKMTRVNSILITKSINLKSFTLILYVHVGPL